MPTQIVVTIFALQVDFVTITMLLKHNKDLYASVLSK